MAQLTIADLHADAARLGMRLAAGPGDDRAVERVDLIPITRLDTAASGTLVIVSDEQQPAPYRMDVALRQASARGLAGLVFAVDLALPETALALAGRGAVPVFAAPGVKPADLAKSIDRVLSGGASEAMMRGADAIARASEAASGADSTLDQILAAGSAALGTELALVDDPAVAWSAADAVCVGEVPIGRLVAHTPDAATAVALPVIASLLSRVAQRQSRDRYAPTQSRADLLVELVLAESPRVEGFVGQAARLGLPLQLSHAVAWLSPARPADPLARAPRSVQATLELFALQLVEARTEMWHVAFLQDDMLIVSTEDHGAGDHQRRVREVATRIQQQAQNLAGPGWTYTLGLGTPQLGAMGLRQSAAEARVAAESAIAAGRLGGVELTDVTGLRRVLLSVYASPISRDLLQDILRPLDSLGAERALTAVRTLLSYLAHNGSLAQAGRELVLHSNGVGYRMRRIRELLDIDLDDPDVRFAVELACRVRLLGSS
ncbi:helix-turn-helix domain-containing protein [Microbacterium sp. HD4P20]|uniref:PucR family transcriptional regulator n=1 Tax=Microbacterium sp. HD4P20 TaxID=2864874 RepID=UPI001C641CAC|nr:PucR family transcriptional regulator [Microbacterium sp. HD4P20]MCP2635429.1 helix-turn-helix domain-containing protein [Microbacterium sp. HD4P20]